MKNTWTDNELNVLRELYPDYTAKEIADVLGKSVSSVYGLAKRENLQKSDTFNSSIASGRISLVTHNLKPTQFKKGQQPFNKGKKLEEFMSQDGIESIKRAWFTKGHQPHNTLRDGKITVRKDKSNLTYKFIRIALGVWKHLHVYNWENANGPVPEGFIVVFRSSDRMNCDVSNLELITRGEHMARNSIARYPSELRQAIRTLKKLTHTINGKE